jgi:Mg/Co/Ni transporter MgtE
MALRQRKDKTTLDLEGGLPLEQQVQILQNANIELETLLTSHKKMLDLSRHRERKLAKILDEMGVSHRIDDITDIIEDSQDSSFLRGLTDRSTWLIGLLVFQSLSSYILRHNEALLQSHPIIVHFLTMLVGAGGNAGNQATVRAIRGIALGTLTNKTAMEFVLKELSMAFALSIILGLFGFLRVYFLSASSFAECLAICIALVMIVFSSIVCGAILPILFNALGIDPAHSSTSIQVIMDISGVVITCFVATTMLDSVWSWSIPSNSTTP